MKFLITVGICLFLSSCDWDGRLVLVNKTDKPIRYLVERKEKNNTMPDLSYCETQTLYDIGSHSSQRLSTQNKWDTYFKYNPDNFARIYIINDDTIKKYGTCEVLKKQMFMKRFDLTYKDLMKSNWTVIFDGK